MSEPEPAVVYHVAPAECRDDIVRWGLSADDVPARNHPWCDRGVYLWASRQAADAWATSPRRGYLCDHADVWRIDVDGWDGDLLDDAYRWEARADSTYQESQFTVDDIEPDRLALVVTHGPVGMTVPRSQVAGARKPHT